MGKQIRYVSLALVALLALVMLAACGEEDDDTLVDDVATRIPVEGAPTELPPPDPVALTAEAATAEAEEAAEDAGGDEQVAGGEQAGGETAQVFRLEGFDIGWRTADEEGPQVDIVVAPGTTIELANVGAAPHNFSIDAKNNEDLPDLGISVDMPVGETVTAEVPADAPAGTYYFFCNVPGHEAAGMYGTITIDPNAAAPAGGEAETEAASPEPEAASPEPATSPEAEAASPEASPAAAGDGAAQTVRLEGYDIGWRTEDQGGPQVALTLAPGAVIELVNVGAAPHNFQAEDLGINEDMPVGYEGSVTIPADAAPGTYEFICNVPGHAAAGMVGTITIDPNAGTDTGAPSSSPAASPAADTEEPPASPAAETEEPAASPAAGGDTAAGETIRLEGYDIGWRTADQGGPQVELTAAPGTVIELVNLGAAPHNFQVDDLGINEDMPVGYEGSITIPEDAAPGTYEFICNVPGHAAAGMVGTITIE